jgi:hypothetical protein
MMPAGEFVRDAKQTIAEINASLDCSAHFGACFFPQRSSRNHNLDGQPKRELEYRE